MRVTREAGDLMAALHDATCWFASPVMEVRVKQVRVKQVRYEVKSDWWVYDISGYLRGADWSVVGSPFICHAEWEGSKGRWTVRYRLHGELVEEELVKGRHDGEWEAAFAGLIDRMMVDTYETARAGHDACVLD